MTGPPLSVLVINQLWTPTETPRSTTHTTSYPCLRATAQRTDQRWAATTFSALCSPSSSFSAFLLTAVRYDIMASKAEIIKRENQTLIGNCAKAPAMMKQAWGNGDSQGRKRLYALILRL